MKALELLRTGEIDQALVELQNEVRRDPSNFKNRVFLFQLLVVLGQWERALTQLNLTGELDAIALAMVQTYREALRCEVFRQKVFSGERQPLVFGKPAQWVAYLLEAFRLQIAGKFAEAQAQRDTAFEAAPAQSGKITIGEAEPQRFEWIADADQQLGPLVEGIINGKYYWIPLENVRVLHIDPPEDLRDVVWMPARFEWTNGGDSVALIPTRYAGSEASTDPQIRLARKTEWVEVAPETFKGLGQRMLTTDLGDYPLMELRKIEFDVADTAAEATNG